MIVFQNRRELVRSVKTVKCDRDIITSVCAGSGTCDLDNVSIIVVEFEYRQEESRFEIELGQDTACLAILKISKDVRDMKAQRPEQLI